MEGFLKKFIRNISWTNYFRIIILIDWTFWRYIFFCIIYPMAFRETANTFVVLIPIDYLTCR